MPIDIKNMFNRIAPKYDWMNRVLSFGMDKSWRRRAVKETDVSNELPILDICCGTGDLTILWRNAFTKTHVVGLDFSPAMLELAKCKIKNNEERIFLLEGDAVDLPFENESFSIVSIAFGLRNIPDSKSAIAEMHRVCSKNGVVVILEFFKPENRFFAPLFSAYTFYVMPLIGRVFSPLSEKAYDYLPKSIVDFDSESVLLEKLKAAGFSKIRSRRMLFGGVGILWARKEELIQ